jgi:uncharacterized protein (DUF488 family)
MASSKEIYALGHSTRSLEQFLALLRAHEIETVIDIRSLPYSSHNPQFNQETLRAFLRSHRIGYRHMKALGGRRHPLRDSINTGWKNAGFRGFADYMQTKAFEQALKKLEKVALGKRCVLICAEAIPWRCHRSLVLDALVVRKWKAFHIQSRKTAKRHQKTSFLKISKGRLVYPG